MTTHDVRRQFQHLLALAVATVAVGVVVAAQQPAPPADPAAARERQAEINKRPDSPGTGRFPAMKEEVVSLPRHVVYRPADLADLGPAKLGVVAWGNGGCSDDGASSRFHLLEIASHGYLVIASGRILSGPGAPPRDPGPAATPGQPQAPRTQVSDLTEAVDWALAENQRSGSPYFGRIDPALIAYSGWSCGGVQALQVAKDPRAKTLVIHPASTTHSQLEEGEHHLRHGSGSARTIGLLARHLLPRRCADHNPGCCAGTRRLLGGSGRALCPASRPRR